MKTQKPVWWQLYLLAPILLALTVVVHLAGVSGTWEQMADGGLVLAVFVGILVWIQVNGSLLERYEMQRDDTWHTLRITVYEPEVNRKWNREFSHGTTFPRVVRPTVPLTTNPDADFSELEEKEEEKWSLN